MNEEEQKAEDARLAAEATAKAEAEAEIERKKKEAEDADLNTKLTKAEEIAANQKIRAEKAEKEAKEAKEKLAALEKPQDPATASGLSQTDMMAILKADIPEEDVDEVKDFAKLKKISVAEALKNPVMKAILSDKKEQRTTSEGSNTGTSKRSVGQVSSDILLEKAKKGEMPDDVKDIEAINRKRWGLKDK